MISALLGVAFASTGTIGASTGFVATAPPGTVLPGGMPIDETTEGLPRPLYLGNGRYQPLNIRTDGLWEPDPGATAIVDGTNAGTNDFRAVVNFVRFYGAYNGFPFCSGTLIDDRWVLTAAHCVDGLSGAINAGDVYVFFSHNIYAPNPQDEAIEVISMVQHPSWNPNGQSLAGDLALVQIAQTPQSAEPMVINDEPVIGSWIGKDLTYVGFGVTSDQANDSGIKRYVDLEMYSYDYWDLYSTDPTGVSNVCYGDSGGAAFETTSDGLELVGVNSFVFNPGCYNGDTGTARVDNQISWIQQYADPILSYDEVTEPVDTGTVPTGDDDDDDDDGTTPAGDDDDDDGTTPAGDDDDDDDDDGGLPDLGDDDDDDDDDGSSRGADPDDEVEFDDELSDPVRPEPGTYPLGARCDVTGAQGAGLWAAFGLLGLLRRRR